MVFLVIVLWILGGLLMFVHAGGDIILPVATSIFLSAIWPIAVTIGALSVIWIAISDQLLETSIMNMFKKR